MKYQIPASADFVRTFKDPHGARNRIVHALVDVRDLPAELPLDPDPRVPKKGPVVKRISQSLASDDGRFHLLNRGITLSVRDVEFDNRKGVLTLNIPANDSYGIIDGGHTYQAVTTVVADKASKGEPIESQFVHLEILHGIEHQLADIAEARNFSVSLKAWTLAGYREKFDWFLKAIGDDYRAWIRISENDEQPVSIVDVIQVMCAANPELYPASVAPVEAYKNAGKCLQYFIDDDDKYGFKKMAPVARDILRLHDYIRCNWADWYNKGDETGKRGRFGMRTEANQRKRNRAAMTTYYFLAEGEQPVQGEYPVEKGYSLPVISSARALLELKRNKYHWYSDPFKFFEKHGPKFVRVVTTANEALGNPNQVGRDPQVYNALYSEVRRWYLEGKLAMRG